jgi:hypothetical protein
MDRRPEDLTPMTDALGWARAHPDMLLGYGYTPSNELLLDRVRDALWILRPDASVRSEVRDQWGYLACDVDWLGDARRDPFRELVPFPEAGPNSFRPEILVSAFCAVAATITATSGAIDLLNGEADALEPEAIDYARSTLGSAGRVVLMRV